MIREYGSPTLFLTFSCAEYDSSDIESYLRKVNKVPDSYPIAKLCTEHPISVSQKYSKKFGLLYNCAARRTGTWGSDTLLLEKGISVQRCTTLLCPSVDQSCSTYRNDS